MDCKETQVADFKNTINDILLKPCIANVFLMLKTDKGIIYKLADIESQNTEPEIREMFVNHIKDTMLNNEELEICNLSSVDNRDNVVYYYDYIEKPEELKMFYEFDIKTKVEKFNFSNDNLNALYGYIIYIGSMDNGMLLFKKHYPISLIKRGSFLIGIRDRCRFEKINEDDIIRLNATFHLLSINNAMYIMDVNVLEQNLGFKQLVKVLQKKQ